ncbi:MAG: response regulator [Micavibrio sp.]|nr:response regulator [Micavibrio sp.]
MTDKQKEQIPILLVEDDDIDAEAVMRTLRKAQIVNPIRRARDGVEAMEMLSGENAAADGSLAPCVILLDINMPRMNGLQLLETLRRQNSAYQNNVVFMLTTSGRDEDMLRAYNANAAGYIMKENLSRLAEMLVQYCGINEMPKRPAV